MSARNATIVRVVRTLREFCTVWADDRPIVTYFDEGAGELAERAKVALESGKAVATPGLESLTTEQAAEREAAHWDSGWFDRDPGTPIIDRLLEAAADAGNCEELDSMFQLVYLARDVLRSQAP